MKTEQDNRTDLQFMQDLLPDHYTCEPRDNGIHCHSQIGIADDKGKCDHFDLIYKAIKQRFNKRFMEIFHQTCTYHKKFTVFIRN